VSTEPLHQLLPSDSFLEWAFLRWVLSPAVTAGFAKHVQPQSDAKLDGRTYRIDYELIGGDVRIAVELDGFAFHGNRHAFTYDRFRQNDLAGLGRHIIRFTYDAIRNDTARCVAQVQAAIALDPAMAAFIDPTPRIAPPDMDPDPLFALEPSPTASPAPSGGTYFDTVRTRLNHSTLRLCQREAFTALANYYGGGGTHAACVMSVGSGKTALGVVASLAFTRRRALIVTPGSVIRGTFDRALDHQAPTNVLYALPAGALIPGCRPPSVLTLDRQGGAIRSITRDALLNADIIVTNFHSLGTGDDPDDILGKLQPGDIDLIVVDEAHIAASESYQRLFGRFSEARTLLMSACFQRLDGRPIDADVVYRYRLIDSIADGHAKNLRVHRFAPTPPRPPTSSSGLMELGRRSSAEKRSSGSSPTIGSSPASPPSPTSQSARSCGLSELSSTLRLRSSIRSGPGSCSRRSGNATPSRSHRSQTITASRAGPCTTARPRPTSAAPGSASSPKQATYRGSSS